MSILSTSNVGKYNVCKNYFLKTFGNKISDITFDETRCCEPIALLKPIFNIGEFSIDCSKLPCDILFTSPDCRYVFTNYKDHFSKISIMANRYANADIAFIYGNLSEEDVPFIKKYYKKIKKATMTLPINAYNELNEMYKNFRYIMEQNENELIIMHN